MEAKLLLCSMMLILASFPFTAYSMDEEECTYVIYLKTGTVKNAGTLSKVSLELRDKYMNSLNITNLESWGIMEEWHDYFRNGNLDVFAGRAKCLESQVCSITLSHDYSGLFSSWYVDFVDVTSISPQNGCHKLKFPIYGWLAIDQPPFSNRRGVYLCDDVFSGGHVNHRSNI